MPEFVNNNDQAVRVRHEGRLYRLRPGQVMQVEGGAADLFSNMNGIDTASGDDKERWEESQRVGSGDITETDAGKMSLDRMQTQLRVQARTAAVAVPLQQVIGDNDAPIGPPTGTITTKEAVAQQGVREKLAFMDHERFSDEADNEGLSEIERLQAEAQRTVNDLHVQVLEEASEAGNEAVNLEALSEGTLSTAGLSDAGSQATANAEKPKPRRARKREVETSVGSDADPGAGQVSGDQQQS